MNDTEKEIYQRLMTVNEKFCRDSSELRWEIFPGTWSKMFPENPEVSGWARSIECRHRNRYVYCIDIDGKGLDEVTLQAIKDLAHQFKLMTGVMPIMKASGSNGAHLYHKIQFPLNWTEETCLHKMESITETLYNRSGISAHKIGIGRYKKKNLGDMVAFVDMRMYEKGHMVRGFSYHPLAQSYSVPITMGDTLQDVQERMRLVRPIPNTLFPVYNWIHTIKLDEYNIQQEAETSRTEMNNSLAIQIRRKTVHMPRKKDRIYNLLPSNLKAVVNMDTDVAHEMKVQLVAFLRYYCVMSRAEIMQWLADNVRWSDFTPDSQKTRYHVNFTSLWVDKRKMEREYFEPQPNHPPIKGWVFGGNKDDEDGTGQLLQLD